MLNSLLNRKVAIGIAAYSASTIDVKYKITGRVGMYCVEGTIVDLDENFIKLDNEMLIAIKYITSIKPL